MKWSQLLVVLFAALSACAIPNASPAAPQQPLQPLPSAPSGQLLVVSLSSEPQNLNPLYGDIYEGNWKIFNGLVTYDKNLNLVPSLAAALPQFSADGKTVTVKLRDGVKFHNGAPLTADDVVFTYSAILDPKAASRLADQYDSLNDVKALDASTVQFTLNRPDPAFAEKLWVGIVPKALLTGKDLTKADFNKAPIGTGPYIFKEWKAGERIVLEANPNYFDGKANIQRIVFTFTEDENARATQLANGSVDIGGLPPKLAQPFRRDARFKLIEVPSADFRVVVLPNQNPILKDPAVRRALALGINRAQMVKGILDGAGEPAYGPIFSNQPSFDGTPIAYDPDKARALLKDAGWTESKADGFLYNKAGTKLGFTLMYPASDSLRKEIALVVRSDLAKVGVDVDVQGFGWDVIKERIKNDANVFGWGLPYDPDLELYKLYHSKFADDDDPFTNPANMKNAAVDAALDAARTTLDAAARKAAYQKFQQLMREDGSWLYTVRLRHVIVVSARVSGYDPQVEPHAHGFARGMSWNLERWSISAQ